MPKYPMRRAQVLSPFGVGSLVDFPGPESMIVAGLDAWPIDCQPNAGTTIRRDDFVISDEPRLAHMLGVKEFLLPPDARDSGNTNLHLTVPILRFPLWHYCRRCGRMKKNEPLWAIPPTCDRCHAADGAEMYRGAVPRKYRMQQVRFVAACAAGHLQDFPWLEWVHQGDGAGLPPVRFDTSHKLELRATGGGGLSAIRVTCLTCEAEDNKGVGRSLAGAFDYTQAGDGHGAESALSRIEAHCCACRPWVMEYPTTGTCNEPLRAALRGATNLHYSHLHSAIWIPSATPANDGPGAFINEMLADPGFIQRVNEHIEITGSMNVNALTRLLERSNRYDLARKSRPEMESAISFLLAPECLVGILAQFSSVVTKITMSAQINGNGTVLDHIVRQEASLEGIVRLLDERNCMQQFVAKMNAMSSGAPHVVAAQDRLCADPLLAEDERAAEQNLKKQEHGILSGGTADGTQLKLVSASLQDYHEDVSGFLARLVLAHKLRETRAFSGFSRFEGGPTRLDRMNMLRRVPRGPQQWKENGWLPGYKVFGEGLFLELGGKRLTDWEARVANSPRLITWRQGLPANVGGLRNLPDPTPRYLLLHTLAHVLMLELIFQCGYSSAALRERIYCSEGPDGMAGILIYTASGDSEGTLGGLVRMGKPGNLELVFRRALDKAGWCSSDPVCCESHGQGPENANLAACHSCALVPETSCETGNRFLDRSVLIGSQDNAELGFFRRRVQVDGAQTTAG